MWQKLKLIKTMESLGMKQLEFGQRSRYYEQALVKKDLFYEAEDLFYEAEDLFYEAEIRAKMEREEIKWLQFELHHLQCELRRSYKKPSVMEVAAHLVSDFILVDIEDVWPVLRMLLFIVLLAVLLLLGMNVCRRLVRLGRGKISCTTVYLLGYDGAHSDNGNGILFSKPIEYGPLTDEELVDQRRHVPANLPPDVLQRRPTDREITRMSRKIGPKYYLLAFELGLSHVQLEHLMSDYPTTLLRIQRMFFIWRDQMESNATFEILVNAMAYVDINPDIVCQCYERA